jgi:hypothetical protein
LRRAGAAITAEFVHDHPCLWHAVLVRELQQCVTICSGGGFSTTETNWTAGYSKGTSRITVASRTGITAGRTLLHLNQWNDLGYPTSSDLWICDRGPTCNNRWSAGSAGLPGGVGIDGCAVAHDTLLTVCVGGTCSGDVDIDPAITVPNIRTGRTNVAHSGAAPVWWTGLEDLSIDHSNVGNTRIQITNATNAWVRNVRSINSGAAAYGVVLLRSGASRFAIVTSTAPRRAAKRTTSCP